jgi:uncharacterized protein (TIGR04255 family)
MEDIMSTKNPRRKYKKDYLKNVIVRVNFDTELAISQKGPKKNIYTQIKGRFPITEEKKVIGKEFRISPESTKENSIESKEWHYYGENRNKHLVISPNFMLIEYKKYEYYENLREDFISVLNELYDSYADLQINRLGLRYIDNIDIDEPKPTQWKTYFIPQLFSIFSLAKDTETVSRAFHILEFNYGEDSLRFQFGMLNPDYPSPIKKKVFTLDHDMYTNKLLEQSEIPVVLDRFHERISNSFERVITNGLRSKMGQIDE